MTCETSVTVSAESGQYCLFLTTPSHVELLGFVALTGGAVGVGGESQRTYQTHLIGHPVERALIF